MKKRIILNYRGGEAEDFLKKWGFVAIPFLKKAEIIAVPSHFLKEIFEKVLEKEVIILPNLIDLEIFKYPNVELKREFTYLSGIDYITPRYGE